MSILLAAEGPMHHSGRENSGRKELARREPSSNRVVLVLGSSLNRAFREQAVLCHDGALEFCSVPANARACCQQGPPIHHLLACCRPALTPSEGARRTFAGTLASPDPTHRQRARGRGWCAGGRVCGAVAASCKTHISPIAGLPRPSPPVGPRPRCRRALAVTRLLR